MTWRVCLCNGCVGVLLSTIGDVLLEAVVAVNLMWVWVDVSCYGLTIMRVCILQGKANNACTRCGRTINMNTINS